MAEEVKAKSFRVTDETVKRLKEISQQLGMNQNQTIARLIDVFEIQASKATMPANVANKIDELNGFLTGITRIYMDMAESIVTNTQATQAHYSSQLRAKDDVIATLTQQSADLQAKLAEALKQKDAAVGEMKGHLADTQAEIITLQRELVEQKQQLVEIQAKLLQQKQMQTTQTE